MSWRGLALVLCGGFCACGKDPAADCEKAFKARDYAKAVALCDQVYAAHRDARAAGWASSAHFSLGHEDVVLSMADRLSGDAKAGTVFLMAGNVFQKRNQLDKARQAFTQALSSFQAQQEHEGAARAAFLLSRSYWLNSDYREALSFAKLSHREAQVAGHDELVGTALMTIFSVLYEIGDTDAAAVFLGEARKLRGFNSVANRAFLSFKEGLLQYAQQHMALAMARYEEAISLATRANLPVVKWGAQLNLLEIAVDQGHLDAADRQLQAAKAELQASGRRNDNGRVALLLREAQLQRARGRLDDASREVRQALALAPGKEFAWKLEQEGALIAELQGKLAEAEEGYERAASIVESMRQDVKFDDMKAWLLASKQEPFGRLFRLRARMAKTVAALEVAERARARTFLDAFVAASEPPGSPAEAKTEAGIDRADALNAILPALRASPIVAPQPIQNVLRALRDDYAWFYVEAGDGLWLISVSRGQAKIHSLVDSLEKVRLQVDRLLMDSADSESSESLGMLLLPADALPPPGSDVYVVPSETLSRISLGALRSKGRYLAEDYVLHYVPSLTALVSMRIQKTAEGPSVVLGDPGGDLPHARAEAEAVGRVLGGTLLLGRQATRESVRALERVSTLHVAAHSGVGQAGAWLALSDGVISTREILQWGLKARLVVLSSCASSATRAHEMWGSLGASFLASGSRSVVAALWSVDDQVSRQFFSKFYESSVQDRPALAVASAQRAFLKAGRPASEWAPFIVLGE